MNLYFTYESRDTLKSFTFFITVKPITNLNLGHCDKFEIGIQKLSRCVHVLQTTQNLVISRCCFAVAVVVFLRYWQTRTHCCGHIVAHDVSWDP